MAGRYGYHLMGIPLGGAQMAELLNVYRDAWTAAGRPGRGRVMLAFHMFCAETREQAAAVAREPLNIYLRSIVDAASDWMSGVASKDYPNYQKTIEFLSKETFEFTSREGWRLGRNPRRHPQVHCSLWTAWSAASNPPPCR